MIVQLLLGHPGQRPGGLVLTLLYFVGSAGAALLVGYAYASACVALPRLTLPLQAGSALVRGVPLLLLAFMLAQLTVLSPRAAGAAALIVYSFTHVGEIVRSFLLAYPAQLRDQAKVMGLGPVADSVKLRLPRTLAYALDALTTHWVSLLKDTGALVVLSVGELTGVAKALSEREADVGGWITTLLLAAALYLIATMTLVALCSTLRRRLVPGSGLAFEYAASAGAPVPIPSAFVPNSPKKEAIHV